MQIILLNVSNCIYIYKLIDEFSEEFNQKYY